MRLSVNLPQLDITYQVKTSLLLRVIASRVLYHKSIIKLIASTLAVYKEYSYAFVISIFYLT